MLPSTIELEEIVAGHTWPGLPAVNRLDTPEGGNPAPPASSLTRSEIAWRPSGNADDVGEVIFNSTDHPERIAIVSAANWEITVPSQILPHAAGSWEWMISTTAADGTRDPLLNGTLIVRAAP